LHALIITNSYYTLKRTPLLPLALTPSNYHQSTLHNITLFTTAHTRYGWIDALRDSAEAAVSDDMFAHREHRFPYNAPVSKEAYHYRSIFEEFFPQNAAAETVSATHCYLHNLIYYCLRSD
jgi:asparagine synthetase B (glutamine-hydrolysing)